MARGKCYVGTSGWSYAHWGKGRFYPVGLRPGDWLPYFAHYFPSVEINVSYYRLPTPEMVARWHDVSPPSFLFAVKMWRVITHVKKLVEADDRVRTFFERMTPLGERRGPLLIQLPPSMRKNVERLDAFLTLVRQSDDFPWRLAVEFRHRSWLDDEVRALLDRHNTAMCLADLEFVPIIEPAGADFVYIRRHGPGATYDGNYSAKSIASDAARIAEWLEQGRDVYIYFNNDVDGHAVDNAQQLMRELGSERLAPVAEMAHHP